VARELGRCGTADVITGVEIFGNMAQRHRAGTFQRDRLL
jgi:hypothetical protein